MALTPHKFDRVYSNLTPSARKVFECTPSEEPWPVHRVVDALVTRGIQMRVQVVHGCLSALTEEGLLKEPSKNTYIRVPVKLPEEKEDEPDTALAHALKKAIEPPKEAPKVEKPAPVQEPVKAVWSEPREAMSFEAEALREEVKKLKEELLQAHRATDREQDKVDQLNKENAELKDKIEKFKKIVGLK